MKTILAPIDFSSVSRRVVAEAVTLAQALRARVVVLHVFKSPAIARELAALAGAALQITDEGLKVARRKLHRLQQRLARQGVTIETIGEAGLPLPVILAHARALDADYLVVGSHGHGAFHDLVAGGTASGVLKRVGRPVLVVRSHGARGARRATARAAIATQPTAR